MVELLVLYTFFAATAVQLFFWLYFFARLAFYKEQKEGPETEQNMAAHVMGKKQDLNPIADDFPPVSIIICAHNESQNLKAHLDRILNQSYRSYEVLVISHNSSDESLNILSSL